MDATSIGQEREVVWIELDRIVTDAQTRAGIRGSAVAEYAEVLLGGGDLDSITLFDDGQVLRLASGHHRLEAYRRAGRTRIPCEVRQGDRWAALEFGIKANLAHRGERLSSADKRHNIALVLRERPEMSDRAIASLCGVHHQTVGKLRAEMQLTGEIIQSVSRTGQDGRTIDVTAIGRNPATVSSQEEPTGQDRCQDEAQTPESLEPIGDLPEVPEDVRVDVGDSEAKETPFELGLYDPAIELCPCGGQWESDGEGSRHCDRCGDGHPENPRGYQDEVSRREADEDDPLGAVPVDETKLGKLFVDLSKSLGQTKRIADAIVEVCRGPHYERIMEYLDGAGGVLAVWRAEDDPGWEGGTPRRPR